MRTGPFGSQLHKADYVDDIEGIPVVMPKDIAGGYVDTSTIARIDDSTVNRLAQHKLSSGDIVLGRRGDIGRRAIVREHESGWLCGTGSMRINLAGAALDPWFFYYYLGTRDAVGWLEGQAVGATMPNLNADIVRSLPVPCPPIVVQRRIASILSSYDDLIANNTRRIAILEDMARTIYREWFVEFRYPGNEGVPLVESELGPVPDGWSAATVGDIVSNERSGTDPRTVDDDSRHIGLEHIPKQSLTLVECGVAADVSSRKWRFESGDVLFGKLRPYFHKVSIAPGWGICSTDILVFRTTIGSPSFVAQTLASEEFVAHASGTATGTDRPRADWTAMAKYPLVVPRTDVLERFEQIVGPMLDLPQVLVRQNSALRTTRDLLLPRLVSGEVDVSDLDIEVGVAS